MGAGDRLHLNNLYRGTAGLETVTRSSMLHETFKKRPVRRGKDGLTADWLLATMSENSDDENLEEGDAVRLLAEVIADEGMSHQHHNPTHARGSTFKEHKYDYGALTEESWLHVCNTLGLLRATRERYDSPFDASSKQSSPPEASSPAEPSGELPDRPSSADAREARVALQELEKQARLTFTFVQEFHLRCTHWDNSLEPAFAPLVLETLLQKTVFDNTGHISGADVVPGGSGALAASILWEYLGWDSPIARRLIRRLSVVFLSYSSDGVMSRHAFLRFCRDAGWIAPHQMNESAKRFSNAFTRVCGSSQRDHAQFPDFILLVEIAGSWRAGPPMGGSQLPLEELPGEAREWPFLESVVLHVTGTRIKATAPEPERVDLKAGVVKSSAEQANDASPENRPESDVSAKASSPGGGSSRSRQRQTTATPVDSN